MASDDNERAGRDVIQPDKGSGRLAGRATDPDGGAAWTVRTYRARGGRMKCYEAVQQVGDRTGLKTRKGFQEIPAESGGAVCTDISGSQDLGMAVTNNSAELVGGNGNTMVTGTVSANVREIVLRGLGEDQVVRPLEGGFFLIALDGRLTTKDFDVFVRTTDGGTERLDRD